MSQKNFASYGDMETLVAEIADKCGPYTEISYEDWLQLTPYQQEHGRWDVTGVPGADGTISIDLMTKLWENPSPSAEMGATSLPIDVSDYDMFLVETPEGSVVGTKTNRALMVYTGSYSSTPCVFRRTFTVNGTNIDVSEVLRYLITNGTQGSALNAFMVPQRIYGIKLHHTVEIKTIAPTVSTLAENCVFDPTGTDLESTDVEAAIKELEANFQNGVDAVYDAVVAKGSTPASHSLSDVVTGIGNINTVVSYSSATAVKETLNSIGYSSGNKLGIFKKTFATKGVYAISVPTDRNVSVMYGASYTTFPGVDCRISDLTTYNTDGATKKTFQTASRLIIAYVSGDNYVLAFTAGKYDATNYSRQINISYVKIADL